MNNKSICFIIPVKEERIYKECVFYIEHLNIPDDFSIEIVPVRNIESIPLAYNKIIDSSDSKYKVYINQNMFIINKNFIYDILKIFEDSKIGMIGTIGFNSIPDTNSWLSSEMKFGRIYNKHTGEMELCKFKDFEGNFKYVKFIHESIMITQYDVEWEEDFKESYFYNMVQCMNFRIKNYDIVTCNQSKPWCTCYGSTNTCIKNEKERLKFLKKYSLKKKIIYVSHGASLNGAQLLSLNIVKILREKLDFEVHIILMTGGVLEKEFYKYGIVYNIEENPSEISNIIKNLNEYGIDKSICSTVISGDIVKLLKINRFKVLSLVHELPWIIKYFNAENKAKNIAEYADKIVFASRYVRDNYQKILETDINNKSLIIPQGLYNENVLKYKYISDTEKITEKKVLKANLKLKEEHKIVLGVGAGDERKGIDLFVKLAKKTYLEDKNILFLWIGDVDFTFIKSRCGEDNFTEDSNIIFINNTMDVGKYYNMADLFILTSREDPFPSVVMESMSLGKPVIAFKDAGGFADIVEDDETGFLVELENIDAMKSIILENIYNEKKLEKMKLNCENLININEKFNFINYVFELVNLIND
ncbi:TPA: glycosyltransferase [Clostridioides difficile]|nr:glycosyltransferase [Clostridioides difficile]